MDPENDVEDGQADDYPEDDTQPVYDENEDQYEEGEEGKITKNRKR